MGENAKKKKMRVGGWKRRKKKIKVPWIKDTKEDDRSSIGIERSAQDVQTF